jgi:hypothetical protein
MILRPEDSDCSGNNVFAFLWEPLCVVGKGITKCACNFGWVFQNKWIWIAVVIILNNSIQEGILDIAIV